jgi:CO dehydrogenase/acetyl-CoA synthase alpha subunit
MPPEARVAIYESTLGFVDEYRLQLERSGHTVVGVAANIDEGADLTPRLEELGVEVILLGDSLVPESGDEYKSEGEMMVRRIKSGQPEIVIVDVSTWGDIKGADYHVRKSSMLERENRVNIGNFVTKI